MNRLPAAMFDAIVTSPPFNLRNSTGGGMRNGSGGKWENAALIDGYDGHDDAMPHAEYVAWQRRCIEAMLRVLKPTGAIYYNHKWRVQDGRLQKLGDQITEVFPLRQIIVWDRGSGFNFNSGYYTPTYEVIYVIAGPDFELADGTMGDVWHVAPETDNPHPAPFPIEIPTRCLRSSGAKLVLDPFAGSGTVAVAAQKLGLDWAGIELSEEYCRMAQNRLAEA
jgi:modification methylase